MRQAFVMSFRPSSVPPLRSDESKQRPGLLGGSTYAARLTTTDRETAIALDVPPHLRLLHAHAGIPL